MGADRSENATASRAPRSFITRSMELGAGRASPSSIMPLA